MARHDADINLRVDLTEGDITATANKIAQRIERIFGRSLASGKLSTSTKSLLASLDKGYNKLHQLGDELDRVKNAQVETGQYKRLKTQLEGLRDKAIDLQTELRNTQISSQSQSNINKIQAQIQANQQSQATVQQQMQDLVTNGQAYQNLLDTDEGKAKYEELLNTLKATNDQMVIYTERAREAKDLGPNLGVWSDFLGGVFNANHGLARFLAMLTRIGTNVVRGGIGLLQGALKKVGDTAKAAAKHLADMAKNTAKSVASGIIGKLKALGSSLTGIGKKTRESNNAFKTGFMTLLRYGLGIRSVYFLFRRLRKALGEGIGNLAQYSPAFNTVISNFISSLTQLKNSFATAFAPIINVVAPILTTFINIVSEAVTKVGMLIAALTGQKTFIRAKAVQTDFAASLDKTSDSTDKANKSAEKYKRTLAGFDDVEILKSPDSNSGSGGSGGGGGGGGGTSPGDMFETVAMPSAFEDWAEKIKEAWANADFTELGQILGEKIATALDNIPWDTIKSYAGKFGKSFATFINGLMFTDEEGNSHLAQAIGRTIAEAINTVFTFANQFITNIDPKLVGNFFADLFNSAVKTIDWNLISNTISEGINNIFSAFESFANKFDFSNLGTTIKDTIVNTLNDLDWTTIHGSVVSVATGLANFVNSLFTPDIFGSLGTTIANALNTAISGIKTFAVNFDAVTFGKAIGTGINNFFDNFNFESAGVTFGTVVSKIATALSTAIGEVKWQDVGADLQGFLKSVPWGELFGDISKLAGEVAGALTGLVAGLFSGLPTAIKDYFSDKKNQYGGSIVYGIIGGIGEAVENFADWIIDNIFKPFIDGFKEAFGISSPAKAPELLEAAGFVGKGILNGIAEPFLKIADWVKEHILDPISEAIGNPIEFIKEKFTDSGNKPTVALDFQAKITSWVQDLKDKVIDFQAKLTSWIENLKDKAVNFQAKLTSWTQDLKDKVINFQAKMTSWTQDLKDKIINFQAKLTSWTQDLKDKVINFKAKMTSWTQDLKNKVINFKAKMTSWSDSLKNKVINFKAKITSFTDALRNKVLNFKAKLLSWFKEAGGAFYKGAWHDIPQYASGGAPRHGTMFVAGEAGAEAVGHIGGRTEVLNQSQMAAVMYSAVLNGTASLVKTVTGHMSLCTNTVITNMGALLATLNFTSTQIYDITNLVDKLNSGLSDIVSGKVVPTRTSSSDNDLMKALNTIIQNQNNVVTRAELQEILTDAFRRYMNIDFYLGDEQIARHANAGNLKLNRRYGTV